jgi:hypothetical protein
MCTFRPVRYKEKGFCSKECYEASKVQVIEAEPIKEETLIEEVQPIEEAIEAPAIAEAEVPVVETTEIKKETNTYKKKKNKYKVHE